MIEVQDLTKRYGGRLAVDHLSFGVQPGTVAGFLGPNGAGKPTMVHTRPDSGEARVADHDLATELERRPVRLNLRLIRGRSAPAGTVR